jgi:hypothetical protein
MTGLSTVVPNRVNMLSFFKRFPLQPKNMHHPLPMPWDCLSISGLGLSLFLFLLSSCAYVENHPPQILKLDNQAFEVNTSYQIEITAFDQDNDAVSFFFELSPDSPTQSLSIGKPKIQQLSPSKAIFSWTPGVADAMDEGYTLKIIVEDEQKARAEESISITVSNPDAQASFSFIRPAQEGFVLDLNQNISSFSADIVIESTTIPIQQIDVILSEAPENTMLQERIDALLPGSQRGFNLSWTPNQAQLAAQDTYAIILIAQAPPSYGLPPVQKRLLVRIIPKAANPDSMQCQQGSQPNTSPTIQETTPLLADILPLNDIKLTAHVKDQESSRPNELSVSILYLLYGNDTPPPETPSIIPMSFEAEEGGYYRYSATLMLSEEQKQAPSLKLKYRLQVIDQDLDAQRNCDLSASLPEDGTSFFNTQLSADVMPIMGNRCARSTDCFTGEECMSIIANTEPGISGGVCVIPCESSNDCLTGFACKRFEDYSYYCAEYGDGLMGDGCGHFKECTGELICLNGGSCGSP